MAKLWIPLNVRTALKEETVKCPRCNNTKICKNGFSKQGKPRFQCNACKMVFVLNPYNGKRDPYKKEPKAIKPVKQPKPKRPPLMMVCSNCNKLMHVYKIGLTFAGKQRYQCTKCMRKFVLNPCDGERPSPRASTRKRSYETKENLAEQKALILSTHKFQTLDSIVDVPCFLCEFQEKYECNPKTCSLLDQWVIDSTQLKLMVMPRSELEPIRQGE